jgi:hypothetical protein
VTNEQEVPELAALESDQGHFSMLNYSRRFSFSNRVEAPMPDHKTALTPVVNDLTPTSVIRLRSLMCVGRPMLRDGDKEDPHVVVSEACFGSGRLERLVLDCEGALMIKPVTKSASRPPTARITPSASSVTSIGLLSSTAVRTATASACSSVTSSTRTPCA